jgi:hypothetical protein
MKEDTAKGIQVAANVAIIVVAVLICAVLAKDYLAPKSVAPVPSPNSFINRPPNTGIQPGTKITVNGVDWAKNRRTLLLAISNKCHFCSESAPFYQRLSREHDKVQLVAVLPQSVEEGHAYLDSLKVTVDDIRQGSFTLLGVRGTPTLILVDSNGTAVKSWVGKLDAAQEANVISSL